jgi:16S rRNA processing protein RimM
VAGRTKAKRILLGRIVGAHGIRGEVVVHAYTAVPEDVATYGPLTDESGARPFEIVAARATPKGVVARIKGIADRNAAEALKGVALYVERARLPAAGASEFYLADLIGLEAIDPAGKTVGRIVGVPNYGAGDLLEIRLAGSANTELIPFTETYVPKVDAAAGRIVVILPTYTGDDPEPGETS